MAPDKVMLRISNEFHFIMSGISQPAGTKIIPIIIDVQHSDKFTTKTVGSVFEVIVK